MTALREEDMQVRLAVGDAGSARTAGAEFARTLAGADSRDFALALAEQEGLIRRAITAAGYTAEQAGSTARGFAVAAAGEWQRIAGAGGSGPGGRA